MKYRVTCPNCGTKVSRWSLFFDPRIYHRCTGCGTRLRVSWTGPMVVIGLQMLWLILCVHRALSPRATLAIVAATGILSVWLLPYFTTLTIKPESRRDAGN